MSKHTHSSEFYKYKNCFFKVNATKSKHIRVDIQKAILGQLLTMAEHHRKLFIFRFDLHISTYTKDNKLVTSFNRRLFKRIKRYYKITRIGFIWVREQEKAKQQHYHYVLMLDGSKVNNPYSIQTWIEEIWSFNDGSCHWAGYHNIDRDTSTWMETTHHLSYLAKVRGKGYRPPQTKDYGSSRLK